MSKGSYNRTALFTVTVPPEFKPQRPWDVPPGFSTATLYMKNLGVHVARRFARLFNARQVQLLQRGQWDRTWMIVSSCCKQGSPMFDSSKMETVEISTPETEQAATIAGGAI
jgi:hypothetical protein